MSHNPFESAARAYELETQRITALAKAQIDWATAAKIGEETHGIRITNEGRELALQRARNQLRRLDAERVEREREAKRLREHGKNLAFYRGVTSLTPAIVLQKIWAAYRVLLQEAPSSLLEQWASEALDSSVREGWVLRSRALSLPPLTSVLALLQFQSENETKVIPGNGARLATLTAFEDLDRSRMADVTRLESEIAKIEAGDAEVLGLVKLLQPEVPK